MNKICRTCLSSSNLSTVEIDENLIEKIEAISAIRIELDAPNYPTSICNECVDKINLFYYFKQVIINSDTELKTSAKVLKTIVNKKNAKKITRKRRYNKITNKRITRNSIKNNSVVKLEQIKIEQEEDKDAINGSVKKELNELEESTLKCNICLLDFSSKSELIAHERICKKEKSLCCTICNERYISKAELLNHRRNYHSAPRICNICGMLVRADNLKKHVQRHFEKPVECSICSKVLKNSESLRGHLLIHKDTSYECEQCGQSFKLKSEYHRHLKKHTDPNTRKKMCPICGKHVRDINRHIFSHSGERPFVCEYCNKGLTSSYALKLHIRQHTNEKPFICEHCNKGFAQKISLMAHLKSKIHSQENSQVDFSHNTV